VILGYLADELRWGIEHAGEAYAVLNACRAQVYLADGRIVSKIAGGRIALACGAGPAAVIGRALDQQQGRAPQRGPGPDAADFVVTVAGALRAAAGA
jgi:streptomycin 3"-adenylyltransferase